MFIHFIPFLIWQLLAVTGSLSWWVCKQKILKYRFSNVQDTTSSSWTWRFSGLPVWPILLPVKEQSAFMIFSWDLFHLLGSLESMPSSLAVSDRGNLFWEFMASFSRASFFWERVYEVFYRVTVLRFGGTWFSSISDILWKFHVDWSRNEILL